MIKKTITLLLVFMCIFAFAQKNTLSLSLKSKKYKLIKVYQAGDKGILVLAGNNRSDIYAEFYSPELEKKWDATMLKSEYSYTMKSLYQGLSSNVVFTSKYAYFTIGESIFQMSYDGKSNKNILELESREFVEQTFIYNDDLYVLTSKKNDFFRYKIDPSTLKSVEKVKMNIPVMGTDFEAEKVQVSNGICYFFTAKTKYEKDKSLETKVMEVGFDGKIVGTYAIFVKPNSNTWASPHSIVETSNIWPPFASFYADKNNFYVYTLLSDQKIKDTNYNQKVGIWVGKYNLDGSIVYQKEYMYKDIVPPTEKEIFHTLDNYHHYGPYQMRTDKSGNVELEICEENHYEDHVYITLNKDGAFTGVFTNGLVPLFGPSMTGYKLGYDYDFDENALNFSLAKKDNLPWVKQMPNVPMGIKNEKSSFNVFTPNNTNILVEYNNNQEVLNFRTLK